ncbi:hypothetical protein Asp14428_34570 [Actinoplanes sp. NBRC 14428]|nr:hypothetical protein Asp14428_34570 [Actinoplanes sp. NBRC 14428]
MQQPALADAGRTAEDQPTFGVARRDATEAGQFVGSADESPLLHESQHIEMRHSQFTACTPSGIEYEPVRG